MKKAINILFITIISFIIFPFFVNATNAIINDPDGDSVYIRKGPGKNYDTVALLKNGTAINLVNTTKHKGTGCDAGWYQLNYENSTDRYICSSLVTTTINESASIKGYYINENYGYRINENYASVRKSASSSSSRIEIIYLGTNVTILDTVTNKKDSSCTTWAKVSYYNNKTGYVCKRLISSYEEITKTDEEYFKELEKAGFPKSYWPYLAYLHEKHPNWIFTASKTNLDFNKVVDGETGKNALQTTYSSYILSNKLREAPNWYTTSNAINAFYLDPRNYLTEKNIFAFENLQYDKENHTKEALKAVFKDTYLETDEYISYFLKAANDFNISPIHLATRAKQEGMSDENYVMVSGTATSVGKITYENNNLDGVYNYYNIGSYGNVPVARGLAAAKGLVDNYTGTPWDTREKAIYYGAKFIGNSYVNAGQNTLYYQKFNTSPTSSNAPFTHQYQTNIIAPASESLSLYESYSSSNLLETNFVFAIPVYNNLPDYFTTHPPIGDTNNDLESITINDNNINGFDKDITTYDYYINKDTTKVIINAKAISSKAIINGIGDINITNDKTTVTITVTSETGVVKTYTLTLIKTDEEKLDIEIEDILKDVDVKISNNYMSGITVNTMPSTLANSINKNYPSAIVTITDSKSKLKTTALATGDLINIKNGNKEKNYIIVIKGDINGDGIINTIDLLKVQKHILKYSILTDAFKEAADTNYDNNVNSQDLLRVQKHILKYITLK